MLNVFESTHLKCKAPLCRHLGNNVSPAAVPSPIFATQWCTACSEGRIILHYIILLLLPGPKRPVIGHRLLSLPRFSSPVPSQTSEMTTHWEVFLDFLDTRKVICPGFKLQILSWSAACPKTGCIFSYWHYFYIILGDKIHFWTVANIKYQYTNYAALVFQRLRHGS